MDEITGYKMLFNTGVRPYNRLSAKDGQFHLGKWEVIKGESIHIIYYLEREPEDNLRLDYLESDITACYQSMRFSQNWKQQNMK